MSTCRGRGRAQAALPEEPASARPQPCAPHSAGCPHVRPYVPSASVGLWILAKFKLREANFLAPKYVDRE